jgi:hypothetical protein
MAISDAPDQTASSIELTPIGTAAEVSPSEGKSRRSTALIERANNLIGAHPDLLLLAVLVVGAFSLAAGLRLWDLNRPDPRGSDEGIHLEQLYLMAAGFRPFRDMAVVQGPLELDYFYLFFNSLGGDIAAARAGAILGSLVCLGAIYLTASRMGGWICGLGALVFLGISPLFLATSRRVLAEAPSMAPACLALWLAVTYRTSGRTSVLLASAACYAFALFLKPMSFAVAVPIFVTLAARSRFLGRDVLCWALVVLFSAGLLTLAIGPEPLYREFVINRLSAASLGWSLEQNWRQIIETLGVELPLLGLAIGAIWPLARTAPTYAAVATSWLAATIAMLLVYSPLWPKHVSYLLPPAALLAGGGVGLAFRMLLLPRTRSRVLSLTPIGLAVVWYLASLPSTLRTDWELVTQDTITTAEKSDLADILAFIAEASGPDDYVVTDHPHLAFLAKRLVPPRLVEPSYTRLASSALTQQDFIQETRKFEPKIVLLWSHRLARYAEWLEGDYSLVRVYGSLGAAYVRKPPPSEAPGVAVPLGHTDQARFGDAVGLAGVELEPVGSGRDYLVTLTWRALQTTRMTSYVAHLELQASKGLGFQDRAGLLPEWRTYPWQRGQSVVQRRWLDLDRLAPGEYLVILRLTRGVDGAALRPSVESVGPLQLGPNPATVSLGRIVLE